VQIDNARVIVTEWRFAPGAETGWHRHGHDYVVVPQTDGELLLETPEGQQTAPLVTGQAYSRALGVEHNVINNSAHEVVFIEIEIR
jgi:quercetin dioxygenase-like cupin family protein